MISEKEAADMAADVGAKLHRLSKCIHEARSFLEILPELATQTLELFDAERLTIYQRGRHDREIVSRFKTGNEIKEIRLPLSATSIAGYVALSQQPVRIDDVYDAKSLTAIHPELKFDCRFDQRSCFRSRSMLVVPIKSANVLLGVFQIINKKGGPFTDEDFAKAKEVADILGQKFRYELHCTQGPFDYLVQTKKVSLDKIDELKQIAAGQRVSIPHLLVNDLKLSPEEVGTSLELYYQVPFLKYDPDHELPLALMKKLNLTYLKNNVWVPISFDGEKAVVLIDDPSNADRIMEVQRILNVRNYEFRVGFAEDILRFLGVEVEEPQEAAVNLEELVGRLESDAVVTEDADISLSSAVDENEATVVQIVNRLVIDAHRLGASDVHVEPRGGKEPAVVRMRVDGVCRQVLRIPASHIRAVIARIKIVSKLDIAERRKPQDGKFMVRLRKQPLELRVATIPTVHGESAVLRLLPSGGALPLERLNFSERNSRLTQELITHPHGLFLVVGPTGSGKTTTLHAILGHINTPERKIWTAEDPVEITQPGLQQVQIEPKIGLDFLTALRAFLRADPDVILIGEIRDRETAHSAIEASLTGHLVFATLHTNSAAETVTRLLDFGLDPMNFADGLLGILAQRLMRTLCSNCKRTYEPTEEEVENLIRLYDPELFPELNYSKEELQLYRPSGCGACGGTGYKGRTGIHELLVATPKLKRLIASRAEVPDIRAQGAADGMRILLQDGIWKICRGLTDLVQLRRVVAE